MGQQNSQQENNDDQKKKEEKKRWEPPAATTIGKKKKKRGPETASRLPQIKPSRQCKLKLLRLERVKDFLTIEDEFLSNIIFSYKQSKTSNLYIKCYSMIVFCILFFFSNF